MWLESYNSETKNQHHSRSTPPRPLASNFTISGPRGYGLRFHLDLTGCWPTSRWCLGEYGFRPSPLHLLLGLRTPQEALRSRVRPSKNGARRNSHLGCHQKYDFIVREEEVRVPALTDCICQGISIILRRLLQVALHMLPEASMKLSVQPRSLQIV
ncbi:hypothetical protein BDV37DRAFT_246469 [Aspergillus pseudonomiae]|uniref:Uncharacterized protein n=1 Tax=Aspergillus pseudonomiae TaxID=1506151 RepID=A0A5N7DF92_9EURO|nr:uncharacterized protein BDV37DRAFT_246469 [Aspergillus pseudonomiae]KAE8404865.1 hypothetical protein BDV37DRAFT_246469 [Aspergillus pseudonomiae]